MREMNTRVSQKVTAVLSCIICTACSINLQVLQRLPNAVWTKWPHSCFCVTMTHRAVHRLLCSNSCSRQTFFSPCSHHILRIQLRVNFDLHGPQRNTFRYMADMKSNSTAELRKIPNEDFGRCFYQCKDRRRDSVCVCVCVLERGQGSQFIGRQVSVAYILSLQSSTTIPGTF